MHKCIPGPIETKSANSKICQENQIYERPPLSRSTGFEERSMLQMRGYYICSVHHTSRNSAVFTTTITLAKFETCLVAFSKVLSLFRHFLFKWTLLRTRRHTELLFDVSRHPIKFADTWRRIIQGSKASKWTETLTQSESLGEQKTLAALIACPAHKSALPQYSWWDRSVQTIV